MKYFNSTRTNLKQLKKSNQGHFDTFQVTIKQLLQIIIINQLHKKQLRTLSNDVQETI